MKVKALYQGFYEIDTRGPRIVEPGTVFNIPDNAKVAKWMEVVPDAPKAPVDLADAPALKAPRGVRKDLEVI